MTYATNTTELIKEIKISSKNTILEDIHKIYNEYSHIFDFIYKNREDITKSEFMGETGFIGMNIDYDSQELVSKVQNANNISISDFCFFSVELLNFLIDKLESNCDSNIEIIDVFTNYADSYKYASASKTNQLLTDKYRILRDLKEQNNNLYINTRSDILLIKYLESNRNFFKIIGSHISWVEEPQVGDYITYNINRKELHSEHKIVCKITNKIHNDNFNVNMYDYKIISYDIDTKEKYSNCWIFQYESDSSKLLEPIHSSYITIHSDRPF